jgi:hypothetical protein
MIPTARTIQDSRLWKVHRTADRSLYQRIAWGRTSRAPLREMTLSCWHFAAHRGCGHRHKFTPRSDNVPLMIDWLSLYQS